MFRYLNGLAKVAAVALGCLALGATMASAQTPTGTVSGRVTSPDGQPLMAVVVSLESPSLQQPQSMTTSPNGDYIFRLLPPGTYTASFRLPGFAFVKETRTVSAAQPVVMDVALKLESVTEEITVTADAVDAFPNTAEASTSLKHDFVEELPTSRTITDIASLAPAVHGTGPKGAASVSGGMSFNNVYLINGVQTQDNLRGTPFGLYIEDAVQETTVTTSGVSAEYGRFSGGVINALTKSGGNTLSGSLRSTVTNDAWRSSSPFGEPKVNSATPTYEFTVGGPVARGKTWFFAAGRTFDSTTGQETAVTNLPYNAKTSEQRYEGKITQSLTPRQRLEVDYIGVTHKDTNFAEGPVMDQASLVNRQLPQKLASVHYTSTVNNNFALEAQVSVRRFSFAHDGGTSRDLIQGTPVVDQSTGASFWAPMFCGVCGNERRDNNDFLVKGSYFLSTGAGAHNIVFGADSFNDMVRSDNHQSGSDYHVWATGSVTDPNNVVYPVIAGGFSTFIINWPIQQASLGSNFRTNSLFFNDGWSVDKHLSLNLGVRYDQNRGRDSSGALVAKDGAVSPRLAATWDPTGNGRTTVSVGFGRYVEAMAGNIAGQASPAGLPSILAYFYGGPDINTDPTQPLVPTDQALRQVFNWFAANAPQPFQATVPGVNTQIGASLQSPHADEWSAGVSHQLGLRGNVRVDAVSRTFSAFYANRTDQSTGQVSDQLGNTYDLSVIQNTNQLTRKYDALNVQGSYRAGAALEVGASYTLSRLRGNVDGEDITTGPLASSVLSYPEYVDPAWNNPQGNLAADQRHRGRMWATWNLPAGGHGNALTLGVIQLMQSGTPYGAVGTIQMSDANGNPYVANPGYVTPPQTVTYYFSSRDAFHTAAMFRTDVALNYSRRLGRGQEAFLQLHLLNAFNQFQLFNIAVGSINTKVVTAVDYPSMQPFNPFTDTPVQGVNWRFGKKFGTPTAADAYTLPRTFSFSVGLRF